MPSSILSRVAANLSLKEQRPPTSPAYIPHHQQLQQQPTSPSIQHPQQPSYIPPVKPYTTVTYPTPPLSEDGNVLLGKTMYSDNKSNSPSPPSSTHQPHPAHGYSSSLGSNGSSMSSSLSGAQNPNGQSERTLSAALRGDYHNDPSASLATPTQPSHSTYQDHSDSRMSVDQPSHPYASNYQSQNTPSHQSSQPPPATSSTTPPVPFHGGGAVPSAVTLAAEQLNQAQAALRQAEEQTRVANMQAAVQKAKEEAAAALAGAASVGQPGGAAPVKVRKTAGKYALKDFQIERTLGTGSFGRVHLVKSRHNARFYAVKVLGKEKVVRMKQVEHTNSEREMLVRVRHPFLVNLWGTFADSKNLYMVMDFVAGGELFSLLRKSQRFPNSVAKFYAAEVALALDYLHSLDIIYRDLKPENILLGADGHVKVTDFGFAKHVPDVTWTLCGTPDYLAPEVVQSKAYNKSVDWYALGVLIYEMLAGYPPFFTEDGNPMKLYEKIIAGKVRYPNYFEPLSKDLLKSLLTSDLTKRFGNLKSGSHDIFGHDWFGEVDWDRLYRRDIPAPYIPKIEGDGDSSQFDRYAECDTSEYGQTGPDPHGGLFPDF